MSLFLRLIYTHASCSLSLRSFAQVYFCLGTSTNVPLLILVLCDLSGIAALVAAIVSGITPVPLMIGYSITTLGGLAAMFIILLLPVVKGCGFEPSTKLIMMSIVNGTSQHKRLDLSAAPDIMDVMGVLGALKRNIHLEYLNLRNVDEFVNASNSAGACSDGNGNNNSQLSDSVRGINILADSLTTNRTLLELDMDWSILGTEAISKLYSTSHTSLPTMLCLRECSLNVADAFRLSNAVRCCQTLQVLDLAHNHLGDEGTAAIASAVIEAIALRGLDLSHNQIGDCGANALAMAVQGNTSLSWLFLYGNDDITEENGIRSLLDAAAGKPELAIGIRQVEVEQTRNESTYGRTTDRRGSSYGTGTPNDVRVRVLSINNNNNNNKNNETKRTSEEFCSVKLDAATAEESHHQRKRRKGKHVRSFSTLELTWEIQLQQLMALAPCTPKELKMMLERSFVYTKVNVFGANKYRKLKKNAHRLLRHFQNLIGSRPSKKGKTNKKATAATASAQNLIRLAANQEAAQRLQFRALLNRLISGKKKDISELPSSAVPEIMLLKMKSSRALLAE